MDRRFVSSLLSLPFMVVLACGDSTGQGSTGAGAAGSGGATSGTGTGSSVGGAMPATDCLEGTNCQDDLDCAGGNRCNEALTPPQCQELFCGPEGSICDDIELCTTGAECVAGVCVTPVCLGMSETCQEVASSCVTSGNPSCAEDPTCLDAFQVLLPCVCDAQKQNDDVAKQSCLDAFASASIDYPSTWDFCLEEGAGEYCGW